MLQLNKVVIKLFLFVIAFSIPFFSYSQLVVDNSLTPQQLVENVFLGGGVTVSNVTVTLEDSRQIAAFTNTNSNLGIGYGVMMSTGYCDEMDIAGVNTDGGFTSASGDFFCTEGLCGNGDSDLDNLSSQGTNDAAVIEFDFVTISNTVSFQYVFASEEYNEYACSDYNDVFAFFLNGVSVSLAQTNIATIPGTNTPVAINSLNNGSVGTNGTATNCSGTNGSLAYSSFFVDNTSGSFIQFDGMTTTLVAESAVIPCETYHIKLAIADVGDSSFDSGVFLEAASFSSSALEITTVTPSGDENVNEACDDAIITFTIDTPATAPFDIPLTVTGTATNGTDYAALPPFVTIPTGQTSVSIQIVPVDDGLGEGTETITIEVPTSDCGTEMITLNIVEEILEAPQSLACTSTANSITFTWNDVASTNWEISLDGGNTWIAPNPGPTTHTINGLSAGNSATIMVQAIGACDLSSISTTTCSIGCNLTAPNISASNLVLNCNTNPSSTLDAGTYTSYLWSDASTAQTTTINNAGTYTVTVTDATGCTASNFIVITEEAVPVTNETLQTCDACADLCLDISNNDIPNYTVTLDGTIVTPSEFSGCNMETILAYSYSALLGNGSQGPYDLLSWEVDGTTYTGTFNNPQELVALMNQSDPTGNWILDAGAFLISGGNTSSTYSQMQIQNLAVPNSTSTLILNTATALNGVQFCVPLGNHQVVVTETATNCTTQIIDVEVTSSSTIPPATITIDNDISCPGGNDGALSVSPSSGYDYLWSNAETTAIISNLTAGTYTVTLTDAATGCITTASINIDNNSIINADITPSATVISCDVPSITLDASASTGQGTLDYQWSTTATNASINIVNSGTFTVTITDDNGCTASSSITITGNTTPPVAEILASALEIDCNNPSSTLDATSSTAQGAISYVWSTNETTATINVNAGGTYTVTITDNSNSCTASSSITLTEEVIPTSTETLLTCDTCAMICIDINPNNILNYEISLDGVVVPISELSGCGLDTVLSYSYIPLLGGGSQGPYQIISWIVDGTPYFGSFNTPLELLSIMNLFDPTGNWILREGSFIIEGGNPASTYGPIQVQNLAIPGSLSTLALNSTNMLTGVGFCVPLGNHQVVITDLSTGCPIQIIDVEVSPSVAIPPIVITESNEISCQGGNDGELSVSPSSGYDYLWSNNETTPVISNLTAGTYTVTLTDAASGCTASASATIESNSIINAIITPNSPAFNCDVTSINLDASASTGQGTLDYIWSTNSTNDNINIVNPGTFTVTITDDNGCTASNSITILSNTTIPSPIIIPSALTLDCNTTSISLDASTSGSTGILTYEWSTTETTAIINVTNAGTYTVTLTDTNNGCTNTASVTISENNTPPIADIQSINNVLDCSNSEATLDASGSSGQGILSYDWSTSETTAIIVSTTAGTYTVTVTDDATGCTATSSIVVSQGADAPIASLVPSDLALDCDITSINLDASASTGQGTLDYIWSTNSTNDNINIVNAGTFTVTITDDNGCTASNSITILSNTTIPSPLIIPSALTLDCNTTSISLDASTSGSTGILTYEWSTTETTAIINVTNAGTYTVTLTDTNNGCTNTASVTISENATPPMADIQSVTNVLDCSNSEAMLDASGSTGQGILSYDWSTSETTAIIVSTTAGTYTVTVTDDATGCTATSSIVVSQGADAPIASLIPSDLALDCDITSINLDASGSTGQGTLNYEWSTSSIDDNINITNAGTFTVTVTDPNGCTASSSITILSNAAVPSPLIIPSALALDCNTTSISLDASTSGSTGTLTYEWSTTETTAIINVTNAGTYTVTLTDTNNDCTNTASVTILENATPPMADIQSVNNVLDCSNSIATLDASGSSGQGILSYDWSTSETTAIIVSTMPGTYTVTITDNGNGCTSTSSIVVAQGGDAPIVTIIPSETMFNCSITTINLDASTSTGQGTLSYEWSTNNTNDNINIVNAGIFTVTVTDGQGCTSSGEINISIDPTAPNAVILPSPLELTCLIDNITLDASSSTGNGSLSYEWQDASTATTFAVTQAGTYTVTITDDNNCTASTSVTIGENITAPIADIVSNPGTILNCDTTSIFIDASGSTGQGALEYLWSNPNASTNPFITVTNAGTYTVTITDPANGCTATSEIEITEDVAPPTVELTSTASILDCTTSSININAINSTGQGPLEYLWNNNSGSTNPFITVSNAGTYTVTITDTSNGCTAEGFINIDQDELAPSIDIEASDSLLNCDVSSITLDAVNSLDPNFVDYLWSDNSTTPSINISDAGTYTVTITETNNGCTSTASIDIPENFSEPVAVITSDELELNCLVGAAILNAATASQGDSLTYEWQDGSTDSIFVVNLTGDYTVIVTETNSGCTDTTSITIGIDNNTPDIEIIPTDPQINCSQSTDTLIVQLNGGNTPYQSCIWDNGWTNDTLIVVDAGTYTVTVTGTNGCTSTASVEVTEDFSTPDITLTPSATTFDCINENITIEATIAGMSGATYEWSTNETGSSIIVDTAGIYTVIATDSITGCIDSASITLINSILSMPAIVGDTAICVGGSTTLDAFIAGVTSYEWSTTETTSSIIADTAGIYTVTISDGTCTATAMVIVTEIIVDVPNITGDASICEGDETTLDAGDYTSYIWSDANSSTSQNIIVDEAGTYTVTVSNSDGCTNSGSFIVSIADAPIYSIIPDSSICSSQEIILGLTEEPGTSYTWTANPTDSSLENANTGMPSASPLETTIYTLIATNGICTIMDSVIVTVGSPKLDVIGDDICGEEMATLFATGTPAGGTYLWTDEDGNEIGTDAMIDVDPASTSSYEVSYTLGNCSTTSMLTVNVVDDPNISIISSEGIEIIAGEGTILTVENVPSGSTYLWTSADGETSEDEDFEVNPLEDISYTVEITTPEGCVFIAEINLFVTTLDIAIPNLFTPNGDELNDKFYIINADLLYEITEFKVFDRWGEVVHDAANTPWDGTYKGKNMPADIYVYLFTIKSMSGEETLFKGDVALMR